MIHLIESDRKILKFIHRVSYRFFENNYTPNFSPENKNLRQS